MPPARRPQGDCRIMCEMIRELVRIPSRDGELAGELAWPDGPVSLACLLVNPHPHMGGTMSNNVIAGLAGALTAQAVVTLRFDYRGVGRSDGDPPDVAASMSAFWESGTAPDDPFMAEDARAAARWLEAETDLPMLLVGYSFGARASLAAMDERTCGLVLIAPTLTRHDFSCLVDSPVPRLCIYSDNDFATPVEVTRRWICSAGRLVAACVPGADHFYRGREAGVAALCRQFIRGLPLAPEGIACARR